MSFFQAAEILKRGPATGLRVEGTQARGRGRAGRACGHQGHDAGPNDCRDDYRKQQAGHCLVSSMGAAASGMRGSSWKVSAKASGINMTRSQIQAGSELFSAMGLILQQETASCQP